MQDLRSFDIRKPGLTLRCGRQRDRSLNDDLFAECGRENAVSVGQRRKDVAGNFTAQRLEEAFITNQGYTAAYDDNISSRERDHLADRPTEYASRLKDC